MKEELAKNFRKLPELPDELVPGYEALWKRCNEDPVLAKQVRINAGTSCTSELKSDDEAVS